MTAADLAAQVRQAWESEAWARYGEGSGWFCRFCSLDKSLGHAESCSVRVSLAALDVLVERLAAAEQDHERLRGRISRQRNELAKLHAILSGEENPRHFSRREYEKNLGLKARVAELKRELGREFETMGLALAAFAPHGGDSARTGDYWAADQVRASLDRARAVLGSTGASSRKWGDGAWGHAGRQSERAERAEARVTELERALRAMLELDSYRPRDGSVNESWERTILAQAFAQMGEHSFHSRMLVSRLQDPEFRDEYERARAVLGSRPHQEQG